MQGDSFVTPPVTTGYMPRSDKIIAHARAMQRRYQERDRRWEDLRNIRMGRLEGTPFDEYVSDFFDKPIIANFIDVTARDLAEMLAPMPSFNCSGVGLRSDDERKKADKRTRIAGHYRNHSRLAEQMLYAADHYFTYSFAMFYVEPDYKAKMPRIVCESPFGGYPEFDRWGRCLTYTKRWFIPAGILADLYPEHAGQIYSDKRDYSGGGYDIQCEMIRFWDKDGMTLLYGGKSPIVLDHVPNVLPGRMPIVIAKKPWLDYDHMKGQFDDAVWVQMAKDLLAKLQFEGVHKSVTAPLAVPNDVQELPYGSDALLRTANPEKVRRVGLEMTNMSFIENQTLTQELREGTRYPATRVGESDASVVTGRGVMALSGGLETQTKSGQVVMREALIDIMGLCFAMDEQLWPDTPKTIKGTSDGTPYALTYTPSKDIKGNYDCDVQYGFAAGLDANRATVLLLQMRADNVISRDYMARNAPFELNVNEEQDKILIENSRDALMQGIYALAQSIPAMASAGMDPSIPVTQIAEVLKGIQKGKPVETAVSEVFAPKPPPETFPISGTPEGMPPAMGTNPAPVQPGAPPGEQAPDIMTALAGLTQANSPSLQANVRRRRAA